jgi:hypothetical protein
MGGAIRRCRNRIEGSQNTAIVVVTGFDNLLMSLSVSISAKVK